MEVKLPLKSELQIYNAYLKTVNWMRKKQLSNKEMEVMSYFMYYNNKFKDLPDDIKQEVLISKKIKTEIRDLLGMKPVVFDNYYKCLRDKGVIKDGKIIKSLQVYPINGELSFTIIYAQS